jgi:hypothetical protein
MTSLNLVGRNVLLTADEAVKKIFTTGNVDPRAFVAAIELAEARFLRPLLGYGMYEQLAAAKNKVVTEANKAALTLAMEATWGAGKFEPLQVGQVVNSTTFLITAQQTLWNDWLWKYASEATRQCLITDIYAPLSNSGMTKRNPVASALDENTKESVGIGLADAKWLTDKGITDRLEPLRESLVEFLCRNRSIYSLWPSENCPAQGSTATPARQTGWITSIYDEEECGCTPSEETPPVPTVPVARESHRIAHVTAVGDSSYTDYRLLGAQLLSFSLEGVELFIGVDADEMEGLDPDTGKITWNSPSPFAQRAVILYKK